MAYFTATARPEVLSRWPGTWRPGRAPSTPGSAGRPATRTSRALFAQLGRAEESAHGAAARPLSPGGRCPDRRRPSRRGSCSTAAGRVMEGAWSRGGPRVVARQAAGRAARVLHLAGDQLLRPVPEDAGGDAGPRVPGSVRPVGGGGAAAPAEVDRPVRAAGRRRRRRDGRGCGVNMLTLEGSSALRLAFFLGIFAAMALWESAAPRRWLTTPKAARWGRNIGIAALNSACVKLLVPLQAVGVAALAGRGGWGLLQWAEVSPSRRCSCRGRCSIWRSTPSTGHSTAPDALAAAHGAPRRPGHRRDHRGALPPGGDPALDGDQVRRCRAPRAARRRPWSSSRCSSTRTSMFNHGNVRLPAAPTACCGWLSSPPTCTGCTTRSSARDGQQLRLQPSLVGPAVRHLPAAAAAGHDGMQIGLPWFRDQDRVGLGWLLRAAVPEAHLVDPRVTRGSRSIVLEVGPLRVLEPELAAATRSRRSPPGCGSGGAPRPRCARSSASLPGTRPARRALVELPAPALDLLRLPVELDLRAAHRGGPSRSLISAKMFFTCSSSGESARSASSRACIRRNSS